VAIMPHCVVCRFDSGAKVVGSVTFADHQPGWQEPTTPNGEQVIGWSNSLGVTAPPGVGLFCRKHRWRAWLLRWLPAETAVKLLAVGR
jgi:hypothetical protein